MDFYGDCVYDGSVDQNSMLECIARKAATAHDDTVRSINVFFLVYASSLVFFMQAGFAMICAGSVRRVNLQNTMLKNLLDACGASIAYFSVGYGFSFGGASNGNTFIGNGNFFLVGLDDSEYCNWLFQFAFAATSGNFFNRVSMV